MDTTPSELPAYVMLMLLGYAVLCVLWGIAASRGYLSKRKADLLGYLLYVLLGLIVVVFVVIEVKRFNGEPL